MLVIIHWWNTTSLNRTLVILKSTGDVDENFLKAMADMGVDGQDPEFNQGIFPMMQGMMMNLLSKDVLYPALDELRTKVNCLMPFYSHLTRASVSCQALARCYSCSTTWFNPLIYIATIGYCYMTMSVHQFCSRKIIHQYITVCILTNVVTFNLVMSGSKWRLE